MWTQLCRRLPLARMSMNSIAQLRRLRARIMTCAGALVTLCIVGCNRTSGGTSAPTHGGPPALSTEKAHVRQAVLTYERWLQIPQAESLNYPFADASLLSGRTFYVDCNGDDSLPGLVPDEAWASLAKANQADLRPGDQLLFKRGCVWSRSEPAVGLRLGWQGSREAPIRVGAYGPSGQPRPVIEFNVGYRKANAYAVNVEISGRFLQVRELETRVINPWVDARCDNQPVGFFIGFNFQQHAAWNAVERSAAFGHTAGVHFLGNEQMRQDTLPHHNFVLFDEISANNVMSILTPEKDYDDLGAWGILLKGNDNAVIGNFLNGNNGHCAYESEGSSADQGFQGNSIELFMAKRSLIASNVAVGDAVFSEIGSPGRPHHCEDNVFVNNVYVSDTSHARFIALHALTSPFGPSYRTVVAHNTVYLTGRHSQGAVCIQGCSKDVLQLHNNIIVAGEKAYYVGEGESFSENHNLFWSESGNIDEAQFFQNQMVDRTSSHVDPELVDPARLKLLPRPGGAADGGARAAATPALQASTTHDIAGQPRQNPPDIGAFEALR